jgi:hypothetical protein
MFTNNVMLKRKQQRARRVMKIGKPVFRGLLGDANGVVDDDPTNKPGYVRVRMVGSSSSDGGLKSYTVVRFRANFARTANMAVLVGYDLEGKLAVLDADWDAMEARNDNPLTTKVVDPGLNNWLEMRQVVIFRAQPIGTPDAPSMVLAVLRYRYIDQDGTFHDFVGDQIDLTSFVPSAGEHCLASIFLKTDDTLEAVASTAKSIHDPLTNDDIQETIDGRSPGARPNSAWKLVGDMTGLTEKDHLFDDLRQWVNDATTGGGGGGSMSSFNLAGSSGTPQTIEDGNTLTIASGSGISTAAGATDTVTVSVVDEYIQDLVGAMLAAGANISLNYNDPAGTLTIAVTGLTSANLSNFAEAVDDEVAALVQAGTGIAVSYNDGANTLTISVNGLTHSNISDFDEAVDDRVAALLQAGTGISLNYNDGSNTLTITNTSSSGEDYTPLLLTGWAG